MRDWDTDTLDYEVNVEYYIDDEDELHNSEIVVNAYPNDHSIREAVTEYLLDIHPQAKQIEITHLIILNK